MISSDRILIRRLLLSIDVNLLAQEFGIFTAGWIILAVNAYALFR